MTTRVTEGAAASNHKSFGAQALHYFSREHEGVRREPLAVPAAWRGRDLVRRDDWIVRLDEADVEELERARSAVRARGIGLAEMHRDDFPLPRLAPAIAAWAHELAAGRGFVLVRGLPVAHWGDEDSALVYWGLGLHLGVPGAQNPAGDLLGHVTDLGEEASSPFVRRYRTRGDIAYHCDLADAVGLLCLRTPRSGGASRIVSSVAVYNELVRRRPDLVARLYEPFLLDSRDEGGAGGPPWVPVPPCRYAHGHLKTFYHSDYFRSVVRHPTAPPFTEEERTLLDLYEEIAASPELHLDMQFERGDVQLLSNHVVLHARTAYRDFAEPERKRHLLRLWLSLSESGSLVSAVGATRGATDVAGASRP
jgi:Taurine catabolism dioxygenase TauD, TfdA family